MPESDLKNSQIKNKARGGALAVSAGIFLSRIMGLVRERVFAHYLGSSEAAGAFRAALKIPNLLQNLFGEGALSASFIPVYSRLLAEGREAEASRVAGTVFSFLLMLVTFISAIGVLGAELLTSVIVPGFTGETQALTVTLIKILFPGIGFLVLSAWCLGVLNSHRRFFLSYVAPVIWNSSVIAALIAFGSGAALGSIDQMALTEKVAWGVTVGSLLQFLVQLPLALRLNKGVLLDWVGKSKEVSKVLLAAGPAIFTRGVVQISAFLDQLLSSYLGAQMVALMAYSQTVYLLPVSLFGIAISAAELPELSGAAANTGTALEIIRERLRKALDRLSFFIIPSSVAMIFLGDAISNTLFLTGTFTTIDSEMLWPIMGVMAVGLYATTRSRLFTSAFWAIGDTKTPANIAIARVLISAGVGLLIIFVLKDRLDLTPVQATAGLAGASVIAAWLEIFLVRRSITRKIGSISSNHRREIKIWIVAIFSGFCSQTFIRYADLYPAIEGFLSLAIFAIIYLVGTIILGISEAQSLVDKVLKRLKLKA